MHHRTQEGGWRRRDFHDDLVNKTNGFLNLIYRQCVWHKPCGIPRKRCRKQSPSPPEETHMPTDPLDAFIAAAARVLDLPMKPDWQPTVKANLEVTLKHAALVAEFELPDDAEPAPIFTA
jgi:hypothetical protein